MSGKRNFHSRLPKNFVDFLHDGIFDAQKTQFSFDTVRKEILFKKKVFLAEIGLLTCTYVEVKNAKLFSKIHMYWKKKLNQISIAMLFSLFLG